jgi:uncharacterized protein (TIGR03000 family)
MFRFLFSGPRAAALTTALLVFSAAPASAAPHGGGGGGHMSGGGGHMSGGASFHGGSFHGGGVPGGSFHGGNFHGSGFHGGSVIIVGGLYGRGFYGSYPGFYSGGGGYYSSPYAYGYPSADYAPDYGYGYGATTPLPPLTVESRSSFYPSDAAGAETPPVPAPDAGDGGAAIVVRVPADADVWFDGNPTKQRGEERVFASPPLTPGREYKYDIRARWTEDGRPVERTRRVAVRANEQTAVDFTRPEPVAAPTPSK